MTKSILGVRVAAIDYRKAFHQIAKKSAAWAIQKVCKILQTIYFVLITTFIYAQTLTHRLKASLFNPSNTLYNSIK